MSFQKFLKYIIFFIIPFTLIPFHNEAKADGGTESKKSISSNIGEAKIDRDILYSYGLKVKDYLGNNKSEFTKAWKLVDEFEFTKALELFEDLAKNGDKDSQLNTGVIYESYPPKKDIDKALFWYKKAVSNNSIKAKVYLGNHYRQMGEYTEALKLLTSAASHGNVRGSHNLSLMYAYGQGVEKNYSKAIELMKFSAENKPINDIEPGYNHFILGTMYKENGQSSEAHGAFLEAFRRQPKISFRIHKFYTDYSDDFEKIEFWKDTIQEKFYK